jgi:hypothetical protein
MGGIRAKVSAHLKAAADSNVAAANFSPGAQTLQSLPGEFRLSACFSRLPGQSGLSL